MKFKSKIAIALIVGILISCCFAVNIQALETSAPENGSWYFIRNSNSGKYMNVAGGSSSSGANIQQWALSTAIRPQMFKLVQDGSTSYYKIVPRTNQNLRVEVDNAWNGDGANIKLFVNNPPYASAQLFRFISNGGGTYRIMPKLSSTRVLEVVNSSTANGANVQLYSYVGIPTQKWSLEKAKITNWSYSNYNYGTYVPKVGDFFAKREAATSQHIATYSIFTLDSHNVSNVLQYNAGTHSGASGNKCYLCIDVTHKRASSLGSDKLSAVYVYSNFPNAYVERENDDPFGDRYEESEAIALGAVSAGVTYYIQTLWQDYRTGKTGNGDILAQFNMSKKAFNGEYNNHTTSSAVQGTLNLNGSESGDP